MKDGIHPPYTRATITCACGNTVTVESTKTEIHTEVCSACHPFYTGQKKLVDTTGRVERFARMLEKTHEKKSRASTSRKRSRTASPSPTSAPRLE